MILSDQEIRAAIAKKAIVVDPCPPEDTWSSTAMDLRLAPEVVRWNKMGDDGMEQVVSPGSANYKFMSILAKHSETIKLGADGFILEPKEFILCWTVEKIKIPYRSRIAARVEGKSSLARLGVGVHVTAPTIHAGFGYDEEAPEAMGNSLQLEVFNVGELRVRLLPNMRICQLIFELVDGTPSKGYDGLFSVQGPEV